eukprot:13928682-Alexandrium_andersonii.AAC.1
MRANVGCGALSAAYAAVRYSRRLIIRQRFGCSSSFDVSELAVQETSKLRSLPPEQLRGSASGSGAPAGP